MAVRATDLINRLPGENDTPGSGLENDTAGSGGHSVEPVARSSVVNKETHSLRAAAPGEPGFPEKVDAAHTHLIKTPGSSQKPTP